MKIHLLAFCVCLVQLRSGLSDPVSHSVSKETIRENIKGASEQFVDDYYLLLQTFPNEDLVIRITYETMDVLKAFRKDENSRTTVQNVKDVMGATHKDRQEQLAKLKEFETLISTQLSPKQYGRFLNFITLISNANATSAEIESCLNYVYGPETTEATQAAEATEATETKTI